MSRAEVVKCDGCDATTLDAHGRQAAPGWFRLTVGFGHVPPIPLDVCSPICAARAMEVLIDPTHPTGIAPPVRLPRRPLDHDKARARAVEAIG